MKKGLHMQALFYALKNPCRSAPARDSGVSVDICTEF